jgi:hypothetical protein
VVWNYRNPAIPASQLEIPLKSIQGDRIISCLIPNTQSCGLVGVNQEGLLRLWETVGLPDQFRELELDLDSDPSIMIAFDVSLGRFPHHDSANPLASRLSLGFRFRLCVEDSSWK